MLKKYKLKKSLITFFGGLIAIIISVVTILSAVNLVFAIPITIILNFFTTGLPIFISPAQIVGVPWWLESISLIIALSWLFAPREYYIKQLLAFAEYYIVLLGDRLQQNWLMVLGVRLGEKINSFAIDVL